MVKNIRAIGSATFESVISLYFSVNICKIRITTIAITIATNDAIKPLFPNISPYFSFDNYTKSSSLFEQFKY
jgi:hypothetical protein